MKSQGKSGKKIIIAVAVAAVIAVIAFLLSLRGVEDFHEKYAGADLSTDVEGMQRTGTYTGYLNDHADERGGGFVQLRIRRYRGGVQRL